MKKIYSFLLIWGSLTCLGSILASCDDEMVTDYRLPIVTIEQYGGSTANSITVNLTPDILTVSYEYAIGTVNDWQAFANGTLPGIVKVSNREAQTVTFNELDDNTMYSIFARAYGEGGIAGGVSEKKLETFTGNLTAEMTHLSDISAGFTISSALSYYYKFSYAVGAPGEADKFMDGLIQDAVSKEDMQLYTGNFWNLEPATDYVFYYMAWDRTDTPTSVFEIPFTTKTTGTFADVDFSIESLDVWNGLYNFKPNNYTNLYIFYVDAINSYSYYFENYRQDIVSLMLTYASSGYMYYTNKEETIAMQVPYMFSNYAMESYILSYPYGTDELPSLKRYYFTTPDPDVTGDAKVELEVLDVTSTTVTFRMTPNENTLLYYYDVFEVAVLEEHYPDWQTTTELQEVHFYNNSKYTQYPPGNYFCYPATELTFTDTGATPGTEYMVIAAPLALNGRPNWGELTAIPITTLEE